MGNLLLNAAEEALLRGDFRTALRLIRRERRCEDSSASTLRLLCCCYLQAGSWTDACNIAAIGAQLYPGVAIFWECWSWAEHVLGATERSFEILERVQDRFAWRENTQYQLACLAAALGRLPEAESYLARAKTLSNDPAAFILKAAQQRELKALWTGEQVLVALTGSNPGLRVSTYYSVSNRIKNQISLRFESELFH